MNDNDLDRAFEADVSAELKRTIVPPPTPEYVRARVERLATQGVEEAGYQRSVPAWRRGVAGFGRLAAAVAIVALVAAGLVLRGTGPQPAGPVSTATPSTVPTPSATPGPTFPPGPNGPRQQVGQFRWIEGLTGYIVVGDRELHMTTDGGITWSEARQLPASTDLGLTFVDARHGWTAWVNDDATQSHIVVYRTSDGGKTWQSSEVATLPLDPSLSLSVNSHFSDAGHGAVLVTRSGPITSGSLVFPVLKQDCRLYTSDDGGVSWSGAAAGPCLTGGGPSWFNSSTAFVLASKSPSVAEITTDGGRSWRTGTLPGVPDNMWVQGSLLIQLDAPGKLRLVGRYWPVSGNSTGELPMVVYESSDGGTTWVEEYRFSSHNVNAGLTAFSADRWRALGGGDGNFAWLLETRDGGRTWSRVGTGEFLVGSMGWTDDQHGMLQGGISCTQGTACSHYGSVYVTNDGGLTWHQVPF